MKEIVKKIKSKLFHYYSILRYPLKKQVYKFPKVETIENTMGKIIENNLSIARFGDGELSMLHNNTIGFQKFNPILTKRLQEIIADYNNEKCLIAIPSSLFSLKDFTKEAKIIFRSLIGGYYQNYAEFLKHDFIYPNAFITRFYMDYQDKRQAEERFELLKKIWDRKEMVIVEGELTRFGIGNDLLSNALEIDRILVPSKNAFDSYGKILNFIKENISKNKIILAAIGPTATVLCYDLSQLGYQAIDIGHADIEYEWFLKKTLKKEAIINKAVNEVKNGYVLDNDLYKNDDYQSQIKTRIS